MVWLSQTMRLQVCIGIAPTTLLLRLPLPLSVCVSQRNYVRAYVKLPHHFSIHEWNSSEQTKPQYKLFHRFHRFRHKLCVFWRIPHHFVFMRPFFPLIPLRRGWFEIAPSAENATTICTWKTKNLKAKLKKSPIAFVVRQPKYDLLDNFKRFIFFHRWNLNKLRYLHSLLCLSLPLSCSVPNYKIRFQHMIWGKLLNALNHRQMNNWLIFDINQNLFPKAYYWLTAIKMYWVGILSVGVCVCLYFLMFLHVAKLIMWKW